MRKRTTHNLGNQQVSKILRCLTIMYDGSNDDDDDDHVHKDDVFNYQQDSNLHHIISATNLIFKLSLKRKKLMRNLNNKNTHNYKERR